MNMQAGFLVQAGGKEESASAALRLLFESRGFSRARVNRFEEYSLYLENKNFLNSQSFVTFMDAEGRLMTLKPDVTLSIVKNAPSRELKRFDKLFYLDEVCRLSKETGEYKMLKQAGVELLGPDDPFVNIEILDLALESLALVGGDFILDVSHLGFVSGLLDALDVPFTERAMLLEALHSKSSHRISQILKKNAVPSHELERFLAMSELSGNILEALPKAKGLVSGTQMQAAFSELEQLGITLKSCRAAEYVNLDFSVVSDLDYYNGLIFAGYVKGVPEAVLSGGRYDLLMRRMGKKGGAIGFAVFLSSLDSYFKSGKTHDFDVLLTYSGDCDYAALLAAAKGIAAGGKSVRLENADNTPDCVCLERWHFNSGGLVKDYGKGAQA